MTRAEVLFEWVGPGAEVVGSLLAASREALSREPAIHYVVEGQRALISGEHLAVLTALKHLEQAYCRTCGEGYLFTFRISEALDPVRKG